MSDRYQQKDNSGHLFRNDRKEKDTHPDFTGEAMINGKKMRVSAWTKTIQNGENKGDKFLSLSFSEPWTGGKRPQNRQQTEEVF